MVEYCDKPDFGFVVQDGLMFFLCLSNKILPIQSLRIVGDKVAIGVNGFSLPPLEVSATVVEKLRDLDKIPYILMNDDETVLVSGKTLPVLKS